MKQIDTCSPLAELWLDRNDAEQQIERLCDAAQITHTEAEQLRQFREQGYLILPGAAEHALIDHMLDDLANAWRDAEKYVVNIGKGIVAHPESELLPHKSRLYDFYVNNEACRALIFNPALLRMLQLIFAEPPLVFQSMVFTWGSEQSIHKDTAFVVIDKPNTLAASWIALEDIELGSGELMYYPGSHRDPQFLFGGERLYWEAQKDGKGIHRRYSEFLDQQAAAKQVPLKTFAAKKGDALIWHANLAHGGTPVTKPSTTRKSLVSHYCPVSAQPRYFSFIKEAYKQTCGEAFFSSSRYDLRPGCFSPYPIHMR